YEVSVAESRERVQEERRQIVVGVAVGIVASRLEFQRQASELGNQLRCGMRAARESIVVSEIIDVGNTGSMSEQVVHGDTVTVGEARNKARDTIRNTQASLLL